MAVFAGYPVGCAGKCDISFIIFGVKFYKFFVIDESVIYFFYQVWIVLIFTKIHGRNPSIQPPY